MLGSVSTMPDSNSKVVAAATDEGASGVHAADVPPVAVSSLNANRDRTVRLTDDEDLAPGSARSPLAYMSGKKPPLPPNRATTPQSPTPFRSVYAKRRLSSSGAGDGLNSAGLPGAFSGSQEDIFDRPASVNVVESDLGALFNDTSPNLLKGASKRGNTTTGASIDSINLEGGEEDADDVPMLSATRNQQHVGSRESILSRERIPYNRRKHQTNEMSQQTSLTDFPPEVIPPTDTAPYGHSSPTWTRRLAGRPLTAPVSDDITLNHAALIAELEAERSQVLREREKMRLRVIEEVLSRRPGSPSDNAPIPKMSCGMDILYRSAQQTHMFTAPIAIVCFLDLENAHAAYAVSPERARGREAAKLRAATPARSPDKDGRVGPPRSHDQLVMRKKLGHMRGKLDQLEAEARTSALAEVISTESKRRAILLEEYTTNVAKLKELGDTGSCVAEAKYSNRKKLEAVLRGRPRLPTPGLNSDEDDDLGLDDDALMEVNMQRARNRRAAAMASLSPVARVRSQNAEGLLTSAGHSRQVSEYLRALKDELDELEPENKPKEVSALAKAVGALPPIQPRPHTNEVPRPKPDATQGSHVRSGSAQGTRSVTLGANLPTQHRFKLSEKNRLSPLVAYAAPDGDLKSVPKRLPPPTSTNQLTTPLGPALPSVIYAAVDIAASRQRYDDEEVRLSYETDPKLIRFGARPSSAAQLDPISAPKRSNEAITILKRQAVEGMDKWARTTLLQSFARAWLSDLRRVEKDRKSVV